MTDDTPSPKAPPVEPTPAAATTLQEVNDEHATATAAIAVGRPTPSPDQLDLPQTASSGTSASSSPLVGGDVEIGGQSIDETPDGNQDASSPDDATMASAQSAAKFESSFITTPLAFKKQIAALAGADITCEKNRDSNMSDDEEDEDKKLSPLPQVQVSTPTDSIGASADFATSNLRSDGLLSGSLVETPGEFLSDANVTDFNLLGREVMAAASTASAMLSRSDGFESMPEFPGDGMDSTMNPSGGVEQWIPDPFPLPPYIQAHLDETYTASTVVFPHNPNADQGGGSGTFIQVTAYRQRNGGAEHAPGTTPPAVSSRSTSGIRFGRGSTMEYNTTGRGKTFQQLSQLPVQPAGGAAGSKKKNAKTKHRPLPLRKRKLQVKYESGDEEYNPLGAIVARVPSGKKRDLVRHNMRSDDDGSRITCRCSKSKCLKLYCDCFQQGKLCSPTECECRGCKNTEANSGPDGIRTQAVEQILARRPDAFEPRTRDVDEGCRCKKNRCLKKYCICFNQGVPCDSRCRCKNCENQPGGSPFDEESVAVTREIEVEPPTEFVAAKVQAEPVPSKITSINESLYQETPNLPGGYTFCSFASPPPLPKPDISEWQSQPEFEQV